MANWDYTFQWVSATTAGATFSNLSNVTSASIERYRTNIVDSLPKTGGRISGRVPGSMPAVKIGDGIRVIAKQHGSSTVVFTWDFIVSDYVVNYGYVTNADTWTIDLEDVTAKLGRAVVTRSWTAGSRSLPEWDTIVTSLGVVVDTPIGGPATRYGRTMSAQTITNGNGATVARTILDTNQSSQPFAVWDTSIEPTHPVLYMTYPQIWGSATGPVFTDGTVSAISSGQWRYDSVDYAALSNQSWDKVTCEPSGLTAQSAGTGLRTYTFDTYNETTTDALQCAQNTLAKFSSTTNTPVRITANVEAQSSNVTGPALDDTITLYFRTQTVYATVIGVQYDMGPDTTRVTTTLAPYASLNFLILDNAILGRLDYNKLGF